ncbi:hypothetical protein [Bosea beijingensis]|uniref:hypothetical protein n=1 Tax=Bosea beijingensis TaxID=3068632 RepID=UPI002741085E|nr:hypothetical protein [Bosea sp. REN20]
MLLALAASAVARGAETLPINLRGSWALDPSDCSAEASADFRIEVTATDVVFAASLWSAPNWIRSGPGWRGVASIDEGGAGRLPGRHTITLRLNRDATLSIGRRGQPDAVYHRCR